MATTRATGFKVTAAIWNALFTNISDAGDYTGGEGLVAPTSPDITYSDGAFNYKKIGRWVWVTGFVVFPATGNGNQAAINNLPFTCENSSQARGGCVAHSAGSSVGLIVTNNTTTVGFLTPATGGIRSNGSLSGQTVFFSFNYRAAS